MTIDNAVFLMGMLLAASSIWAKSETSVLSIAEAERMAVSEEPGILSAHAKALSLADKAISSSSLPDPQIRLGVINVPSDDYSFAQEAMTQKQIGFRQVLPRFGSRNAKRRMYQHESRVHEFASDVRAIEVILNVRKAWLELYYWRKAKNTVTQNRSLFSELVKVTRSLYSVGKQNQQDMITAELELSRLQNRLLRIDEQIYHSEAVLARWVGKSFSTKPLSDKLPSWTLSAKLSDLKSRLHSHPMLLMANAKIESSEVRLEIANTQYKPSIALDLNYGIREEDQLGNERDDFISFMVTMDIPLFTGNRQDKQASAARNMQDVEKYSRELLLRNLNQELESHFTRWQQLQFRLELFDQTILKQSKTQSKAALKAYQNDTGDFNALMRAYIAELDTYLEYIRLQVDQFKALAELDYLVLIIGPDHIKNSM